jgi:hypothetical protein
LHCDQAELSLHKVIAVVVVDDDNRPPQPSAASEANEMHEGKKSRVSSTRGAC